MIRSFFRSLTVKIGKLFGIHPDVGALISGSFRLTNPSRAAFPAQNIPMGSRVIATGMWNYCFFQFYRHFAGPYWVERQYNPNDPSFIPRATSLLSINLTHRTWMGFRSPSSSHFAMIDPAGALSPVVGYYTIEIALREDGRLRLPARGEMTVTQHPRHHLPLPVTELESGGTRIVFTAGGHCQTAELVLGDLEYSGEEDGKKRELIVGIRPFNPEGAALIHSMSAREAPGGGTLVALNGIPEILFHTSPLSTHFSNLSGGDAYFVEGDPRETRCPYGITTGTLVFPLRGRGRVAFSARSYTRTGEEESLKRIPDSLRNPLLLYRPLPDHPEPHVSSHSSRELMDRLLELRREETKRAGTVDRKRGRDDQLLFPERSPLQVHGSIKECASSWERELSSMARFETARSEWNQAAKIFGGYLLSLQTGDSITPGIFTYDQFWFRDAAYMLRALSHWNLLEPVERVLQSYPARQKRDGFFKSHEGEWDSNGQAIWSLVSHWKLTGNRELLEATYPSMKRGALWIEKKRRVGLKNRLMPPGFSAEHLGPADYYYWDNLWSIAALQELTRAAGDLNQSEDAARFAREASLYRKDLLEISREEREREGFLAAGPHRTADAGMICNICLLYPLELDLFPGEEVRRTVRHIHEHYFHKNLFFHPIIHSGYNIYLSLQMAQSLFRLGELKAARQILKASLKKRTEMWTYPEAIHPRTGGGVMGDGFHGWAFAEFLSLLKDFTLLEREHRLLIFPGLKKKELMGAPLRFGPFPVQGSRLRMKGEMEESRGVLQVELPEIEHTRIREYRIHLPLENRKERYSLRIRGGELLSFSRQGEVIVGHPSPSLRLEYSLRR